MGPIEVGLISAGILVGYLGGSVSKQSKKVCNLMHESLDNLLATKFESFDRLVADRFASGREGFRIDSKRLSEDLGEIKDRLVRLEHLIGGKSNG